MAKAAFKSVDEYIAAQPENVQPLLTQMRNAILEALPKAEEVISYQMPTYKIDGDAAVYFAAWKQHVSFYPANDRVLAAFENKLVPYAIDKSTIRFKFTEPIPVRLIQRIAKFRVKELAEGKKRH